MTQGRSVPGRYVTCRTWQHHWDFTTVERSGGEFVQGMRCDRCGTERRVSINSRTGMREHGNKYVYPEDMDPTAEPYKMPKDSGGALSQEERASLRLAEVKGHYRAVSDELSRQRAKKKA